MSNSSNRPETAPKNWLAAALSAVVPGLGHVYAGQRRRGQQLILLDALALLLLFLLVRVDAALILKLWASPSGLVVLTLASLLLLGFRAWAAWDAYRVAEPASSATGTVLTWLVGVLIVVPHIAFGILTAAQYSFLTETFADDEPTVAAANVETTRPPVVGRVTTTTAEPPVWDGVDRLNLLLLGTDTGTGRTGIRTDTMIVVSMAPSTGETVLISLPRNLSGIDLPDGFGLWECDCFPQLLNDLWDVAETNPDAFPGPGEPGPRAIKATIGHLLDLEIHYYALVTLDGFVGIVDALGGVDIYVPNRIVDEIYPHEDGVTIESVVIEEGQQHLDGHLALAYARIRRHADDFARMNRQRCILGAVVEQSSPIELLANYPSLLQAIQESMSTDIPLDRLPDFIDLLPKLDLSQIAILHVDRDYISHTADRRTFYDQERIRAETHELLADPAAAAGEGLSFGSTCS